MIPKKIHYCWFGGNPLPELDQRCIASWKKYLPEYEIKEWNENNFDVNSNAYVKEAYESKKFAFVTDYVRLYAIYHEGGIYMDTDVEVLKPLDELLQYDMILGFESNTKIQTAFIACKVEIGHEFFKELIDDYNDIHFILPDGSLDMTANVVRVTKHLLKYGLQLNNQLQTIKGITILPKNYLCPKDDKDGKIYLTDKSYTIHHFAGSWLPKRKRYTHLFAQYYYDKLWFVPKFIRRELARFLARNKYRKTKTHLK